VTGLHESTIARVTSGKYVETPRGTFELKFFFSSGLERTDGEITSSRSTKALIHQIVDSENPHKPMSDQEIAKRLAEKGIRVARRTVAKYREQLHLLPAKLRKETP
jgi:RNA polymerase sigma-54 factor